MIRRIIKCLCGAKDWGDPYGKGIQWLTITCDGVHTMTGLKEAKECLDMPKGEIIEVEIWDLRVDSFQEIEN